MGENAFDFLGRQVYQQNQFGDRLGGPIIQDRTFCFLEHEGLCIPQATPQRLLIPTPALRAGYVFEHVRIYKRSGSGNIWERRKKRGPWPGLPGLGAKRLQDFSRSRADAI
jgi:hypothetical protein